MSDEMAVIYVRRFIDIKLKNGYNIIYLMEESMKKVANIQTKDYIVEAIRNEILAGNMKAEEELTQEELAATLGVSRMPVREALQTLVQEGFVERLPNRHMQVVALNPEQIKETFRVIAVLETEMTEMLIEKGTDITALAELTTEIEKDIKPQKLAELELGFHQKLAALLDNKYLSTMHDKLMHGYISYAIEQMGEHSRKVDLLTEIIKSIGQKECQTLKKQFLQYYMYYAGQFKKVKE